MQQKRNCGSCRYFHNAQRTLCKRFPPQPAGKREAFWPAVMWDDTCGEWAPRVGEDGRDNDEQWNKAIEAAARTGGMARVKGLKVADEIRKLKR